MLSAWVRLGSPAVFQSATAFDQNVGAWDTAAVTNMASREQPCFQTPLAPPTRALVAGARVSMRHASTCPSAQCVVGHAVFRNAAAFDRDISSWNTPAVTTMAHGEPPRCRSFWLPDPKPR